MGNLTVIVPIKHSLWMGVVGYLTVAVVGKHTVDVVGNLTLDV